MGRAERLERPGAVRLNVQTVSSKWWEKHSHQIRWDRMGGLHLYINLGFTKPTYHSCLEWIKVSLTGTNEPSSLGSFTLNIFLCVRLTILITRSTSWSFHPYLMAFSSRRNHEMRLETPSEQTNKKTQVDLQICIFVTLLIISRDLKKSCHWGWFQLP